MIIYFYLSIFAYATSSHVEERESSAAVYNFVEKNTIKDT